MNIVKGHREKGVGTAVMRYVLDWAKDNKLEKITLSVFSNNSRAINLYEKFGFQTVGVRRKQYIIQGNYVDEVIMEKVVSG